MNFIRCLPKSCLLLVLVSCPQQHRAPHSAANLGSPVALEVGLSVRDRITAVDTALSVDGDVRLVWIAKRNEVGRMPRSEVWYAATDAQHNWTTVATRIDAVGSRDVKVFDVDGKTHILVGNRLSHFVSDDGGASWSRLGPLIPAGHPLAMRFDAVVVDEGFLVVFQSASRPNGQSVGRESQRNSTVFAIRWRPGGQAGPQGILDLPTSVRSPQPRLAIARGDVHLVAGTNLRSHNRSKGGASILSSSTALHHTLSRDGGLSWSKPSPILTGKGEKPHATNRDTHAVDLAVADGTISVVYSSYGVFLVSSIDGGSSWTIPQQLAPYKTSSTSGTGESLDVKVVARKPHQWDVIWVDERYQRVRAGRGFMGGLLWSDDPGFEQNNDVFRQLVSSQQFNHHIPTRLTREGSFAGPIALDASDDVVLVVWAGRRQVGVQLESFEAPPQMFVMQIK